MAVVSQTRRPATSVYPESDGKPMAETDTHREQMIYLIHALNDRYRDDPQVYVSGNLLIYYEEGDPRKVIAPDTFVVFGVPKRKRRVYKIWEERKTLDVVFEITSKKTRRKDIKEKWAVYAQLSVQEYFLFDPLEEYLKPPLQGYRLVGGVYLPIGPESASDGDVAVRSEVSGVVIRREGSWPILYDAQTGERLLTSEEVQAARRQAETHARQAEEEVQRLKVELERLLQSRGK